MTLAAARLPVGIRLLIVIEKLREGGGRKNKDGWMDGYGGGGGPGKRRGDEFLGNY